MPESHNSPSVLLAHTKTEAGTECYSVCFLRMNLLILGFCQRQHTCGMEFSSALLCHHFYHGYQVYIYQKGFLFRISIYICSVYQQEIIFCTATSFHPLRISLQSPETLIIKNNLYLSFHLQSVQKHKIGDNVRLEKTLLAFSGLPSHRFKPTVSHIEACKHH